jgi:hypothetical protein
VARTGCYIGLVEGEAALIGAVFDLLFSCKHRRTTFPFTPVKRKTAVNQGEFPDETYVVCLECGKQFSYDWEHMRLGNEVNISNGTPDHEIPTTPIPFRTKTGLKYLAWGSAVSAALLLGKAAQSRRRSRKSAAAGQNDDQEGDIENPQNPSTPRA